MTPWDWRPRSHAWGDLIISAAKDWLPPVEVHTSKAVIKEALETLAGCDPALLLHPCARTFIRTYPSSDSTLSDLVSLSWLTEQSGNALGVFELNESIAGPWLREGCVIPAGCHSLGSLVGAWDTALLGPPLSLDVNGFWVGWLTGQLPREDHWYRTIGCAGAWQRLRAPVVTEYYRQLASIRQLVPACADWLEATVHVVISLTGGKSTSQRSASYSTVPALVFCDLASEPGQLLEVLVHEAAHLCLYLQEVEAPLVDPNNCERFRSPLRKDPRPLRGILLAFHALAYIAAAKIDFWMAGGEGVDERDLYHLRLLRDDAGSTIMSNVHLLTRDGRTFLEQCTEVVNHFDKLVG